MSKQEFSYRYILDSRIVNDDCYSECEHNHALVKLGKAYAEKYAEKRDMFVYSRNGGDLYSEKELSREEMQKERVGRLLRKEVTLTLFGG